MNYETAHQKTNNKNSLLKTIICLLLIVIGGLIYTNIKLVSTKSDLEYELDSIQNSVLNLRNEVERQ